MGEWNKYEGTPEWCDKGGGKWRHVERRRKRGREEESKSGRPVVGTLIMGRCEEEEDAKKD